MKGKLGPTEYEQKTQEILKDRLKIGDKLLDLGCGIGRFYNLLSKLVGKENYIGLDVSIKLLGYFLEDAKEKPILIHWNSDKLPFAEKYFDKIWIWSVFTHLSIDEAILVLIESKRVLKDEGLIYASFFLDSKIKQIKYNAPPQWTKWNYLFLNELLASIKLEGKEIALMPEGNNISQSLWEIKKVKE